MIRMETLTLAWTYICTYFIIQYEGKFQLIIDLLIDGKLFRKGDYLIHSAQTKFLYFGKIFVNSLFITCGLRRNIKLYTNRNL